MGEDSPSTFTQKTTVKAVKAVTVAVPDHLLFNGKLAHLRSWGRPIQLVHAGYALCIFISLGINVIQHATWRASAFELSLVHRFTMPRPKEAQTTCAPLTSSILPVPSQTDSLHTNLAIPYLCNLSEYYLSNGVCDLNTQFILKKAFVQVSCTTKTNSNITTGAPQKHFVHHVATPVTAY